MYHLLFMHSNLYNRYLWLLNTLLLNKRLSFSEISKKWEQSFLYEGKPLNLRTFHDHRNAVEEMFHVSIECDNSDGHRYYIENATALKNDRLRKWLLNSFNITNLVNEGQQMSKRILLEDIPCGAEYISTIIGAMQQNKVLRIEYQAFYEGDITEYLLQPYCMKMSHQRWYILGKANDGLRHFALDRIMDLEMTDDEFIFPKNFSPKAYYSGSIGIWVNESVKPERVVLRAYGQMAKYFCTLPLHPSQKEIIETDKYADFEYQLSITRELVLTILSKGRYIKVLEPNRLCLMVEEETKEIMNLYSK